MIKMLKVACKINSQCQHNRFSKINQASEDKASLISMYLTHQKMKRKDSLEFS